MKRAITGICQGARRFRWPLQSGQQNLLALPNQDGTNSCRCHCLPHQSCCGDVGAPAGQAAE